MARISHDFLRTGAIRSISGRLLAHSDQLDFLVMATHSPSLLLKVLLRVGLSSRLLGGPS